ncbi:DENN domain-containing protein 1A [Trichinella britovi]|uniref:DENN domain-containing protein 1A n=1 Tax=Trichinella britovi TaxID=45882 RepID=A0A0V1D376_TRIBR|nr:DENN domain-containing protein 1A [Trichinella britovi]
MASRLRLNPVTLFDVFAEVASNESEGGNPWILWKYPDDFNNEKILRSIAEFSYPCTLSSESVQLFSFVLTDLEGCYTFGFCRHAPRTKTCYCLLSALPWPEVFFKFLNHIASVADQCSPDEVERLLDCTYHQEIPLPNQSFVINSSSGRNALECLCPDNTKLPKIPENRYLTEYFNAVNETAMIAVFASMLCERRIIFKGNKLGKLSSCVLAANLLIYPMHWQHIFIPVLPAHLCHYLNAPMPYLIGVPSVLYEQSFMQEVDLNDVVMLDIDSKLFRSPYDDVSTLPYEVISVLKKNMRLSYGTAGDGLARAFLRALVVLIGGYREALQFRQGELITFSPEAFVQTRPSNLRPFLDKMLDLQIFRQFIDDRLDRLNTGVGFQDQFEEECNCYSGKESSRIKYQYNEWMNNMKKEGGAWVKQIRSKVKLKGKEAMNDIRNILGDLKEDSTTMKAVPPIQQHSQSCIRRARDKLMQKAVLPLKAGRSKWMDLNVSKDDNLSGEEAEEERNTDSKAEEHCTKLQKNKNSTNFDLMSEMQEVLSRRSSVLVRLEQEQEQQQQQQQQPSISGMDNKHPPGTSSKQVSTVQLLYHKIESCSEISTQSRKVYMQKANMKKKENTKTSNTERQFKRWINLNEAECSTENNDLIDLRSDDPSVSVASSAGQECTPKMDGNSELNLLESIFTPATSASSLQTKTSPSAVVNSLPANWETFD